jgi:phospholipid-binding lipoprotein MlaA
MRHDSPRSVPARLRPALLMLLLLAVAGCVTGPKGGTYDAAQADPWENSNRRVYALNKKIDRYALKPAALGYRTIVPRPARQAISNGFSNYNEAGNFVNAVAQGKIKQAFRTLDRFLLNSTLGVGGLADVATKLGRPQEPEDFGQTLAEWGIKSGPFVVLPFFGPSTVRDGVGLAVDIGADPVDITRNIIASPAIWWRIGQLGTRLVGVRSQLIDQGADALLAGSLDEYTLVKTAYLQRRYSQIWDGNPPFEEDDYSLAPPAVATPPKVPVPVPDEPAPPVSVAPNPQ